MAKNKTRQDKYIFGNDGAGFILLAKTRASLASQDITSSANVEDICGTKCLVLTVTGTRPGEGKIAKAMKEERP